MITKCHLHVFYMRDTGWMCVCVCVCVCVCRDEDVDVKEFKYHAIHSLKGSNWQFLVCSQSYATIITVIF
jgi:hypothetical protein